MLWIPHWAQTKAYFHLDPPLNIAIIDELRGMFHLTICFECRQQQHLMTLWLRLIVLYDLKIISTHLALSRWVIWKCKHLYEHFLGEFIFAQHKDWWRGNLETSFMFIVYFPNNLCVLRLQICKYLAIYTTKCCNGKSQCSLLNFLTLLVFSALLDANFDSK